MTGRVFTLLGKVDVIGVGETLLDVTFPVRFLTEPHVSGSGALGSGETMLNTKMPTWSVGVAEWSTVEVARTGTKHFLGARLVLVCTGRDELQRSTFHYAITGRALTNPVAREGVLTDPI